MHHAWSSSFEFFCPITSAPLLFTLKLLFRTTARQLPICWLPWSCFFHEVLSSKSAWGVFYIIPSWAVVLFPRRLLYLDLESRGVCIHLFPLHLLFSCWVATSFTFNHLSSLQNQHPTFLKTKLHSKFLFIVCTVFTRDSTWLSLFPNSFKSSLYFLWCSLYSVLSVKGQR